MTRKRLNLSYIENDPMRRATFNKRKKGFLKKIHELSVLCGIEACAVVYSPSNSTPEAWPSNVGVKNVVEKFQMLTDMEQEKKMVNHEGFLKQNISKAMGNNKRKMKDNAERMMKEAMFELLGGKEDRFKLTNRHREDLCKYIDQYLKELHHHKNKILRQSHVGYGESSEAATNVMAPTSSGEVNSQFFPTLNVSNSPSQIPEEVNAFPGNNFSAAADQQDYYPVMNPAVGFYDHNANVNHLGHNQYQQEDVYRPSVHQDGIDNPSQNQNQQEEWLVSDDDLS
ncbi:PREDICTED: agamous-like MADS-box protein AGL80 [Camelina sativa]|uniref:Agamous-like MADS-box protein AGL80 n=1 Tax=Camelina sativa TaxID=90675 RepID=A0ABM1R0G6_CAMSA|nr:PREDICTED: agamous-like MADS-box protein AGL80 [Camelina sativa]